jgi:surfactin synthase thioesterase subunit
MFPGGHFYFMGEEGRLAAVIATRMKEALELR